MNSYLPTATAMRSVHASFIGRTGWYFSKFSYSLLPLIALLFVSGGVWGQAAGDFRSRQSGDWNQSSVWERYDGTNWIPQSPFPEIAATASSAKTVIAGTTHTVSLPSGIEIGDLLLIFWTDANTDNTDPGDPAGWTQLYSNTAANRIRKAWYRISVDGMEGATLDITAGAERSAHVAYRIAQGTYQGMPAVPAGPASGNSVTPNPPSLTPGFSTTNTLWIAAAHSAGDLSVITSPTNYGGQVSASSTGIGNPNALMITASRELDIATEDPDPFTGYVVNRQWAANTVAIHGVMVTGSPSDASGEITIRSGHTVTVTAATTIDQCIIEAGGLVTVNAGQTLTIADGTGTDLSVNGTVVNSGTITMTGTAEFNAASRYEHAQDGGSIPVATWDATSTCEVTGAVATTVTGVSLNQTFGNFVWNCAGQTGNLNIATAAGTMSIAGNLEILDTGTGRVHLNQTTLAVMGNFIQSGGTFRLVNTINPRTLNVGGNFELSGATTLFIVKNGAGAAALNIDGNFTQTDGTFDQRTANTTSTSVVAVGGDFNLNGGTYDISGINAVGNLNVAGNFSHTGGTLTETAGGIGNGVITLDGSAMQTFTTTGWGALDRINFVLDNSGDGVQLLSPLTINANTSLTFTDGIVDGNGNLVTFNDNAITSGASNASFVNGVVRKIGNDAFVFPIGKGTTHRPLTISTPSGMTTLQAEYFIGDAEVEESASFTPVMGVLEAISNKEYWNLSKISMDAATVTITFGWNGASMADDMDRDNLRVARFSSMDLEWVAEGGTTSMDDPEVGGTITSGMISSFSLFTLGSSVANNALPIELLAFTATAKGKTVQLDWRTATELNNAYFQIERSTNGRDFEKIGKVAGAGTSHAPLDYAFTDQLPKTGWNYYRLKQVDFDGEFSYSPVQAVQMGKDGSIRLQVFPNPANDELNLKTDRLIEPADRLEIYDYTGRQVMSFSAADAVNAPVVISQLPAGTYMLRLRTAEGISSAAFVKQ